MRWLAIAASALSMGCASATELTDAALMGPFVLHEPEPCGMAFDVQAPELLAATLTAAERWSAATGCDVRVADGGLPIIIMDELQTTAGDIAAGACRHREGEPCSRIDIHSIYGGPRTIAHEIGHALAGVEGHSATGLMAEGAPGGQIDSASLELVCRRMHCETFAPEG
jgi:hypothetical protein